MKLSKKMMLGVLGAGGVQYWQRLAGMYGASVVEIWEPDQANQTVWPGRVRGLDAPATGLDWAQAIPKPGGGMAPRFTKAPSYVNIFSNWLRDHFPGAEGTLLIWQKIPAAAWYDTAGRAAAKFLSGTSYLVAYKRGADLYSYTAQYGAGGVGETVSLVNSQIDTDFILWSITWSKDGDAFKLFKNKRQQGTTQSTLGTWDGTLSIALIGAETTSTTLFDGWIGLVALLDRPLSQPEIEAAYLAQYPSLSPGDFTATNAAAALTTPTYDGSGQVIHPDVYYNSGGWNGHKYWMGITPYPALNDDLENPSILVSEDGQTWAAPAGLTNPIVAMPDGGVSYNSDPDISMSPDGVTMWLGYCERNHAGNTSSLKVRSSTDGITWTEPTEIATGVEDDLTSPAFVHDGTNYVVFYVNKTDHTLHKRVCATMTGTWGADTPVTVLPARAGLSHVDVIKDGDIYWLICHDDGSESVYLMRSNDAATFVCGPVLLAPGAAGAWDDELLYRPTMVRTATGFDIWYSGRKSGVGHIGFTRAANP